MAQAEVEAEAAVKAAEEAKATAKAKAHTLPRTVRGRPGLVESGETGQGEILVLEHNALEARRRVRRLAEQVEEARGWERGVRLSWEERSEGGRAHGRGMVVVGNV
eukprot:5059329-Prymnesium_polylepis.1